MNMRSSRCEDLEAIAFEHPNKVYGQRYEPTPEGVIEDMFLELDFDIPAHTFIDLGSGKGRALFYASAFPFKRIIGVEFAPKLHRTA